MPTIEANGVHLYYELSGGHGEPVVLIHGSWTDHLNWNPVVVPLSDHYRVLTYDRRGHGMSGKTGAQGSGEEDAMDAAALLLSLGLVPAHVIGNSFGGSIALKLAASRPETFRSVMVHEPPLFNLLLDDPSLLPVMEEGRKRRERVVQVLEGGDRAGAARLFVETLTVGPGAWERMPAKSRERMIANADTWLDETRDLAGSSVDLTALGLFKKPTLLSYGGRGMQGSKLIIERLAKAMPGAKVDFDPDAGHAPHVSNPER